MGPGCCPVRMAPPSRLSWVLPTPAWGPEEEQGPGCPGHEASTCRHGFILRDGVGDRHPSQEQHAQLTSGARRGRGQGPLAYALCLSCGEEASFAPASTGLGGPR